MLKFHMKEPHFSALCVRCKKTRVETYKPFCSERCSKLDLYSWLNEDYRLPTEERGNQVDEEQ
jgi:endogenous inhibitor of DNA gyrase (YacG/DUF329 family)